MYLFILITLPWVSWMISDVNKLKFNVKTEKLLENALIMYVLYLCISIWITGMSMWQDRNYTIGWMKIHIQFLKVPLQSKFIKKLPQYLTLLLRP